MRLVRLFAVALSACPLVVMAAPAGAAQATPSDQLTYHFTDCVGPAGTPTTFDATKQPSGSASLRLTDGSGVFVVKQATDSSGTILFTNPGLAHNTLPTTTCHAINQAGQENIVTGILTPAAAGN